jgi:hypothetical protein
LSLSSSGSITVSSSDGSNSSVRVLASASMLLNKILQCFKNILKIVSPSSILLSF